MLGLDQGGIEGVRYANLRPVFTGSAFTGGTGFDSIASGASNLAVVAQDAITHIALDGGLPITLHLVTSSTLTDPWFKDGTGGSDGVRQRLQAIADTVTNDTTSPYVAERCGYHVAFQRRTPGTVNDVASSIATVTVPDFDGGIVDNVRAYALGNPVATTYAPAGTAGNDGAAPHVPDYTGDEPLQTGLHALDSVDLFNLVVIPGDRDVTESDYEQIIGPASTYCEDHRAFLIIDAPPAWTNTQNRPVARTSDVNNLRALVSKNHSAVFYPKAQFSDAGVKRLIGPAGMIAGLMARIDSTRGVWKAPAGIEADLRGVLDARGQPDRQGERRAQPARHQLHPQVPGRVRQLGRAHARGSDDAGVRVEVHPDQAPRAVHRGVALPRHEVGRLRAQRRAAVGEDPAEPRAFMMGLFRQGAFQGSTPGPGVLREVRRRDHDRRTTATSASSTSRSASRRSSRPSSS